MAFGFGDPTSRRRDRARKRARGPLADYYAVRVPEDGTPASELRLLSLDFETTGLDPATSSLLSAGFVPVTCGSIELAGAGRLVVRGTAEVGQSATVHGLTDDVVSAGVGFERAIETVLAALAGRVLLAHFADIEVGVLSRACERLFGAPFVSPTVDTMALAHRRLTVGFDAEPSIDELRLWSARARYGLPRYLAHEALTDAIAGAELYLAQVAELPGTPTLASLRSD